MNYTELFRGNRKCIDVIFSNGYWKCYILPCRGKKFKRISLHLRVAHKIGKRLKCN